MNVFAVTKRITDDPHQHGRGDTAVRQRGASIFGAEWRRVAEEQQEEGNRQAAEGGEGMMKISCTLPSGTGECCPFGRNRYGRNADICTVPKANDAWCEYAAKKRGGHERKRRQRLVRRGSASD